MNSFYPHDFKEEVRLLKQLEIVISQLAYDKMYYYVDIADGEVGWIGTVSQYDNNFLIEDVYLLEQKVSAATTELLTEGITKLSEEILQQPNGLETWNKIRFWGHSHVNMDTSPSGQDESQSLEIKTFGWPYLLRGILNKRGRMEFTLFLFGKDIRINDVRWKVRLPKNDALRTQIEGEFEQKVTKHSPMIYSGNNIFNIPKIITSGSRRRRHWQHEEKEGREGENT